MPTASVAVAVALGVEWFRDQNGFRAPNFPASYYEATLGFSWKPSPWLLLRI